MRAANDKVILWIWNERHGVKTMEGTYGDHYLFFSRDMEYDDFVRGYAVVIPAKRQVRMLLTCNRPENNFFPTKVHRHFIQQYRGYNVVQDVQTAAVQMCY